MQLVIRQVFNNNSALVEVGANKEAIIQGKGIAFGKRRGDKLDSKDITKVSYLDNENSQSKFSNLLKDIPIDIVVTVFDSIDNAKRIYHLKLLNYLYITLSDHVFQMYKRLMAGQYHPSVVPDIGNKYPVEYTVASEMWTALNQNLHVFFPKTEIKSLALHFINAQGDEMSSESTERLVTSVNQIVQSIFAEHHIKRNIKNHNYFDRLMIHLEYLVERMEDNIQDGQEFSEVIINDLYKKYPISFEIADEIAKEIFQRLSISLTENERLYFLIHIQRLINEKEK